MGTQLPDWMTGDYTVVRAGRTTAVVRNDFVDVFDGHRLIDCPRTPLLSLPGAGDVPTGSRLDTWGGRGGVRVVPAGPLGEAVVRPYRRGGLVEKFNRRRYFLGDRAFSELVATHRLWKRGAPVPEALAAVQYAVRPGYVACFVTRRISRTAPAATILARTSGTSRGEVLQCMGRAIRLLHEAGGDHPDLNAHNLLVPEEGEGTAFVIDLDRVSVLEGPIPERRAHANLRRLQRSLRKLHLDEALAEWSQLERAYAATPDALPAA